MNALLIYTFFNIIDKLISNIKIIVTTKGSRNLAVVISMCAGYVYAFVLMSANYDIDPQLKAAIMSLCGGLSMWITKTIEKRLEKTKLWEIKVSVNNQYKDNIIAILKNNNMEYYYNEYGKHTMFGIFCYTKDETKEALKIVSTFDGRYFITESTLPTN